MPVHIGNKLIIIGTQIERDPVHPEATRAE